MSGNQRFVQESGRHDHRDQAHRLTVAKRQAPFAVIVGCSDSRVPTEVVFDQGLGDLFIVRTAGQVTSAASMGSIEYAVEHLGTQLVVVLGHLRCGAVDAAVKGGEAPGQIGALMNAIEPAVDRVRHQPGSLLANAVDANIRMGVANLRASNPILSKRIAQGTLRIVGAHYDLESGVVTIVPVTKADEMYWQRSNRKMPMSMSMMK